MTKLNITAFKKMVNKSRSKTALLASAAKEQLATLVQGWALSEERDGGDDPLLDFTNVTGKDVFTGDELSLDHDEKAEKNTTVVVNWLVKLMTELWNKVSQQAEMIRFNLNRAEAKEVEVASLRQEVEKLRIYCDEVQQRSMKGNLILSSPEYGQKKSLLKPGAGIVDGDFAKEDATLLCCRLIERKTGVVVPKEDISACHMLKKQGVSSSFIIRFHNMKPGSAWDSLTTGLMTGKALDGTCFTNDNIFINYQVTKARGELLQKAREARRLKKIHKYSTDQNGDISIQVKPRTPWTRISSSSHLQQCISSSRQPAAAAQHAWHRNS